MQKEFKNLLNAIDKWNRKNEENICFIGAFVSFDQKKLEKDEDDVVMDNICMAYGYKDTMKILLNELIKRFEKDKRTFINW